MRSFEVLKCPQVKIDQKLMTGKNPDGSRYGYTQYKEVNAGEKCFNGEVWYPGAYGVSPVKPGDVIKLSGHLADKAANNPSFKEVKEEKKVTKKKASKK